MTDESIRPSRNNLPDKFVLSLSFEQINQLIGVMAEAPVPFKIVNPLVVEIQRQAQEQINQHQKAANEAG